MRPVNLIPPEERRGEAIPLRAGVASYVIVGALAVALMAVIAVVLTGNSINQKKADLASLQARQAAAQQKAAELAPYTQFATDSQATQAAVQSLADSRFDWRRVLHELALVIPKDVWLESMTGTVAPGVSVGDASGDAATDSSIAGPALQIVGCGRDQDAVAGFLASVKDIDGVTRVGFSSSQLGEQTVTSGTDTGSSGSAAATSGEAQTDCQTRPSVAKFNVTVAFDAVPASLFTPSADGAAAVPATTPTDTTSTTTDTTGTATTPTTTTTPGATTTPTTAATASTDGVSDGQADEQSGRNASNAQINKAKNGASAVGVGG